MLVVAAFIEQVVLEVKNKDERVEALALKHCSLMHKASPKINTYRDTGKPLQYSLLLCCCGFVMGFYFFTVDERVS